ncbi:MAG: PEGA domain-containing protein [Bradymonadaceae bacterium]|nr:PEGA domain-containing protein [Lujinxingiaceae bacterium]
MRKLLQGVWCTLLFLVCFSLPTSLAWAQDQTPEALDPYREFVQGNRLASAGALTRAIPHYENVIRIAGERYPLAHFNLAEVFKQKRECARATVLYRAYIAQGNEQDVINEAHLGIRECKAQAVWPTLSVRALPADGAIIRIDGYIVSRAKDLEKVEFAPGQYLLEVSSPDYRSHSQTITLVAGEPLEIEASLSMETFYGSLQLRVEPQQATIRIVVRELDAPHGPTDPISMIAPIAEPLSLVTGKYFIEITHPNHQRWIRNIQISRDSKLEISASLQRELPAEIR